MTDYQNELVMEHLDLVNWVIRTRISVPNRPLLTYDDFYAIGCEAICRAALKYRADSGEFAPFACRYEELHKKFYDKMEETEIEPSSFDKSLEMLVKRKLIIKGVGYTGADALYNMLSDTYVIPLRGVQGTQGSAK